MSRDEEDALKKDALAISEDSRLLYSALVQYQKAIQEQNRAMGMILAAFRTANEQQKEQNDKSKVVV